MRGFHDDIEIKVLIDGKPVEYEIEKESTIHTTNIIVTASSLEGINVEMSTEILSMVMQTDFRCEAMRIGD